MSDNTNAPRGHCAQRNELMTEMHSLPDTWTLHRVTRGSREPEPGRVGPCLTAAGLRSGHDKVPVTLDEYILETECTLHTSAKKDLQHPDNHNGVITHLEPDILECKVKWALGSITTNKTPPPEKS